MADIAALVPQPDGGLPPLQTISEALGAHCVDPDCRVMDDLRRSAQVLTAEVSPGIVRTVRPWWCPGHRYYPEQLAPDARGHRFWVLRDLATGRLVGDGTELYRRIQRHSTVTYAQILRELDELRVA